jgi:hypothetical protein
MRAAKGGVQVEWEVVVVLLLVVVAVVQGGKAVVVSVRLQWRLRPGCVDGDDDDASWLRLWRTRETDRKQRSLGGP